jgi:predicted extracellular nuclease
LKKYILIAALIFTAITAVETYGKTLEGKDTLMAAFWNLENLFDAVDDPVKDDAEFLPESEKNWTNEKVEAKLSHLARVINSMNSGKGPDVLGVAEVEHQALLDEMIAKYFNNKNYGVVYAESPDARGIDVGLIYNKDKFSLAGMKVDTVTLPDKYATRLILNGNLVYSSGDTLHFFINHWPSRRGGAEKSEINRIAAAKVLRNNIDRLFAESPESKIIMMGDFNDNPTDKSISEVVKATVVYCDSISLKNMKEVSNLALRKFNAGEGSYFYQGKFDMIDQIMISNVLLKGAGIKYLCESFEVYKPDFMVTQNGKYKGSANPTFGGKSYLGGYSDHFPVTAKFLFNY